MLGNCIRYVNGILRKLQLTQCSTGTFFEELIHSCKQATITDCFFQTSYTKAFFHIYSFHAYCNIKVYKSPLLAYDIRTTHIISHKNELRPSSKREINVIVQFLIFVQPVLGKILNLTAFLTCSFAMFTIHEALFVLNPECNIL